MSIYTTLTTFNQTRRTEKAVKLYVTISKLIFLLKIRIEMALPIENKIILSHKAVLRIIFKNHFFTDNVELFHMCKYKNLYCGKM